MSQEEEKKEPAPKKVVKRRKKKQVEDQDTIPNMELVIIGVFFASFLFWAVSKCSVTQSKYEEEAIATTPKEVVDTLEKKATVPIAPKAITPKPATKTVIKDRTTLFVVLDGLKVRTGPTRDSAIVRQLSLNTPVYFSNEVTPFKEKINMGSYIAEEPWVKVQTKEGFDGWVYGAGVNYYRAPVEKVEAVEEELGEN